jgi:aspartate/methionine/tyrosine aminotransferase
LEARRQLGLFDATMIVMGGIVGSGVFMNPSVVAQHVHTPFLILGVWLAGGVLAMLGAFIWAELAARLPGAGGQYLYLREAYHPSVAFLYGWVLMLVTQTGGMAAVAVTFARYWREISGSGWSDNAIAAAALLGLTAINCFGARAGSNVQSTLMLTKTAAIAAMVVAGLLLGGGTIHPLPLIAGPVSLGAAMIPVAFAYGGWQTSTFVAAEMRDPQRDLTRGLVLGVSGVVALYLSVNFVRKSARTGRTRGHAHTGIGSDARGDGRAWRVVDRDGHRGLNAGVPQPGDADGPARVQRDGARRPVLRAGGTSERAHRSSCDRNRAAGRRVNRDRMLRRLRADSQLRGERRFHLVRTHRGRVVSAQGTQGIEPDAGAPVHDGGVRTGVRGDCREHRHDGSGEQRARMGHHFDRGAGLLVLELAATNMRYKHSDYMHWAKTQSRARFNLATSGVGAFPLAELGSLPALEINGDNSYGYGPLKRAIARKCGVEADCVVTAAGTSMANYLAFAALVEPGDEVLVEHPAYGLIVDALQFVGAVVRRFPRREENGWAIYLDEVRRAITPKTRLIVVTNLHNPSSVLTPEETLRALGDLGPRVLVDEVYLDAVYENTPPTAFRLGPQFVVTNSLTKIYGVSGIRCGWILAEPDLAQRMWRLNDLFAATPVHPGELLSVAVLENLAIPRERARRRVDTDRKVLAEFLDRETGVSAVRTEWGTTCFVRLLRANAEEFLAGLRAKQETSAVPGRFFEMPDYFRVGMGVNPEMFAEGLRRLALHLRHDVQ